MTNTKEAAEPPIRKRQFASLGEAQQHLRTARTLEEVSRHVRAHLQSTADWAEAESRTSSIMTQGGAMPSIATASMVGCTVLASVLAEIEPTARSGYLAAFIGMIDDFAATICATDLETAPPVGAA